LGPGAVALGMPSLYFLAYGLTEARGAYLTGRKGDAYATAALAFGTAVLLFIAFYPVSPASTPSPGAIDIKVLPRGLVSWMGIVIGGLITIPTMAVVIPLATSVGASLGMAVVQAGALLIGLAGAAGAGCLTGLGLAMVEVRATGATGRIKGHVRWIAVTAMCVYASLKIPFMPVTVAVAMVGMAIHASRMPAQAQGEATKGRGTPVVLCWVVAAYAAFVAMFSGAARVGSQYIVYVP